MKLKYTYFFLLSVLAGLLFAAGLSEGTATDEEVKRNDKIIKFSHSFHAELAECADCHSKAAASTTLKGRLMPDHGDCGTCHDVEDSEQCGTCHYEDVYEPLVQNENELLFSHSFHVTEQKMECESCHKGFKGADYGFQAAQTNPVMADCYSCHNDMAAASNACESCHISTVNLLPQSHKDIAFIRTHKFDANDVNADCIMCHDNNNNTCQDCHVASGIDAPNTANNFFQPYSPNTFSDGAKKQNINRVHEFNYRFLHGIDAKSKRAECESCHETTDFCASCHQGENGDYALGGIMPASHLNRSQFIIGGIGSGGGEHARLAKRDIESCVSCHDVQGADPTCLSCHTDYDGIKGTNNKTHARNFMRDVKGDWHDSQGSMCFNCHTTSTFGNGFCGYCHTTR
ncbi:MAG: cytochrome c3 family protein [Ignavibacteriaceae bacterium]